MKTLALILTLATGEQARTTMPAWECHTAAAEMHHAWHIGGHVDRDDGIRVTDASCEAVSFLESLTSGSDGDCGEEA